MSYQLNHERGLLKWCDKVFERRTMAVEICQVCEKKIGQDEKAFVFKDSIVCEECYEFLRKTEDKYRFDSIFAVSSFNIRQFVGLIGVCLLIVGVFLVKKDVDRTFEHKV